MQLVETDAGILLGKQGEADQRIVLLSPTDDCATWLEALEFAQSLGGLVPNLRSLTLLKANLPEKFKNEWYWSCESLTGPQRGCAWAQSFLHGRQAFLLKTDEINAVAIRRLPC